MDKTDPSAFNFWAATFGSKSELEHWALHNSDLLAFRRSREQELEHELPAHGKGTYLGYCWVCKLHSQFSYDWSYALGHHVNWREGLICKGCGLPSRLRLSVHVFDQLLSDLPRSCVYLTEQLTPTVSALRARCGTLVCSEFLGANVKGGTLVASGVRHEDLTRLSFTDSVFDAVLSFDVFEHIPDYRSALREVCRVLRPGGRFMASVPFGLNSDANVVRAVVREDGGIEHLLPPEYHGDPINPEHGVLCYYHFGWELLRDLRAAGFTNANLHLAWSSDYAYIGPEQPLIIATA